MQWDKDDCAWMGLVKFDLLGLGMLAALQYCFDLVQGSLGEEWSLDSIPKEEQGVYDMLCRADSIGVFQVESRAQMGMLPRLQPREFYDLVVEIALVRPGPIQGGAVHPYVRRKRGEEAITLPAPAARSRCWSARSASRSSRSSSCRWRWRSAAATGQDADLLRRAMGSKRGVEKIESLRAKLYAGMAGNGIVGDDADEIYARIQAFANFGFAESHSLSFALLVYASAWMRLHYPAAFLAALLRAQPMGFYSPQTLVADARRHGVEVLRPDILRSGVDAGLELARIRRSSLSRPHQRATIGCLDPEQPPVGAVRPRRSLRHRRPPPRRRLRGAARPRRGDGHRRRAGGAHRRRARERRRLREHGRPRAPSRAQHRPAGGARRRRGLRVARPLAARGALDGAGMPPRTGPSTCSGSMVAVQPPLFSMPSEVDVLLSDLWATGISPDDHPLRHLRPELDRAGRPQLGAAGRGRTGQAGRGRRGRHPPPAAADGERHHLHEPRRRDGTRQRDLQRRGVGALPPRRPRVPGAHRARHPGALPGGGHQPARRPFRSSRDRGCDTARATSTETAQASAARSAWASSTQVHSPSMAARRSSSEREARGDADVGVARVVVVRERRPRGGHRDAGLFRQLDRAAGAALPRLEAHEVSAGWNGPFRRARRARSDRICWTASKRGARIARCFCMSSRTPSAFFRKRAWRSWFSLSGPIVLAERYPLARRRSPRKRRRSRRRRRGR